MRRVYYDYIAISASPAIICRTSVFIAVASKHFTAPSKRRKPHIVLNVEVNIYSSSFSWIF